LTASKAFAWLPGLLSGVVCLALLLRRDWHENYELAVFSPNSQVHICRTKVRAYLEFCRNAGFELIHMKSLKAL